jgi:thioester reductase-like protein
VARLRLLLTGANGFVGNYVRRAVEAGATLNR